MNFDLYITNYSLTNSISLKIELKTIRKLLMEVTFWMKPFPVPTSTDFERIRKRLDFHFHFFPLEDFRALMHWDVDQDGCRYSNSRLFFNSKKITFLFLLVVKDIHQMTKSRFCPQCERSQRGLKMFSHAKKKSSRVILEQIYFFELGQDGFLNDWRQDFTPSLSFPPHFHLR